MPCPNFKLKPKSKASIDKNKPSPNHVGLNSGWLTSLTALNSHLTWNVLVLHLYNRTWELSLTVDLFIYVQNLSNWDFLLITQPALDYMTIVVCLPPTNSKRLQNSSPWSLAKDEKNCSSLTSNHVQPGTCLEWPPSNSIPIWQDETETLVYSFSLPKMASSKSEEPSSLCKLMQAMVEFDPRIIKRN